MNTEASVSIGLPAEPRRYKNFIDGAWSDAADGASVTRLSSAHDVPVGIYPRGTVADADRAVAAARRAFDDGRWSDRGGADRATVLLEAARLIRSRRDEIALIETLESGNRSPNRVAKSTGR